MAQHAFLRKVVSDRRLPWAADAVVIEEGSARHRRSSTASWPGKPVSRSALAASWRDRIGGGYLGAWDAPIYGQFLRTVHDANRGRPARHCLRLLLGDPSVEWEKARTAEDMERCATPVTATTPPSCSSRRAARPRSA